MLGKGLWDTDKQGFRAVADLLQLFQVPMTLTIVNILDLQAFLPGSKKQPWRAWRCSGWWQWWPSHRWDLEDMMPGREIFLCINLKTLNQNLCVNFPIQHPDPDLQVLWGLEQHGDQILYRRRKIWVLHFPPCEPSVLDDLRCTLLGVCTLLGGWMDGWMESRWMDG